MIENVQEKDKTYIRLRISKMVLEELKTRAEYIAAELNFLSGIGISRNNRITLLLFKYAKGEIQLTVQ